MESVKRRKKSVFIVAEWRKKDGTRPATNMFTLRTHSPGMICRKAPLRLGCVWRMVVCEIFHPQKTLEGKRFIYFNHILTTCTDFSGWIPWQNHQPSSRTPSSSGIQSTSNVKTQPQVTTNEALVTTQVTFPISIFLSQVRSFLALLVVLTLAWLLDMTSHVCDLFWLFRFQTRFFYPWQYVSL